jgi:hypothetical protein
MSDRKTRGGTDMENRHPCKDCTKRHYRCHSTCPEGLRAEEITKAIRAEKQKERMMVEYYAQKQIPKAKSKFEMQRNGVK